MDIRDAVCAELDKAAAAGERTPSLRVLRARVGRGSLTTISDVVKEWEARRLTEPAALPCDLTSDEQLAICRTVWRIVAPMLESRIKAVRDSADARVAIEQKQAVAIREESEVVSAKFAELTSRYERSQALLQEKEKELSRAGEYEAAKTKECDELRNTLAAKMEEDAILRRENAALRAELDTLKAVMPFIRKSEG